MLNDDQVFAIVNFALFINERDVGGAMSTIGGYGVNGEPPASFRFEYQPAGGQHFQIVHTPMPWVLVCRLQTEPDDFEICLADSIRRRIIRPWITPAIRWLYVTPDSDDDVAVSCVELDVQQQTDGFSCGWAL